MTNKEHYLRYGAKSLQWRKNNPEKAHAIQVNYRRRKGQLPREEFLNTQWKKENNPNWGGGKAYRTNNEEWRALALKIWKRDSFKCQLCSIRVGLGVKPVAHHRIPYNLLPEDDEGNLITLCNSCHLKVHWKIRKEGDFVFV